MLKCSIPECKKKPEFLCSCSPASTKLCIDHCGYHMNQNISLKHLMSSIYTQVDSTSKSNLISIISSKIQTSKSLKANFLQKLQNCLETFNFLLSSLAQYEKNLHLHLTEVLNNSRIPTTWKTDSNFQKNQLEPENLELPEGFMSRVNDINDCFKNLEIKLMKASKEFEHCEKNYELFFTTEDNENLLFFNKSTLKVENLKLDHSVGRRWGAAICDISDGKVFVYGGSFRNNYFDDAYLVDIKRKTTEFLSFGIHRRQISPEYLNKKIYVFGGFAGYSMTQSSCFDLCTKVWSTISPIPFATRNTSTLSLESDILIAGQNVSLLSYGTTEDKYKEISANFQVSTQNVLVRFRDKIILITNQRIFVIENTDFSKAKAFQTKVEFGTVSSKPTLLLEKNLAFFADYRGTVFVINCKTYEINIVD